MRAIRRNPCESHTLYVSGLILFVRVATGTCDCDGPRVFAFQRDISEDALI